MDLKDKIRTVPNFPKEGVMFGDITTLLQDADALEYTIKLMLEKVKGVKVDVVVATESRGFIFGAIIAYALKAGFVPLRKPGKLPWKTRRKEFDTEYSKDCFEIHEDAVKKGDKCLIVDDIIATGGSARAACELVEELGGEIVGVLSLITLTFLGGEEKLRKYKQYTIIREEK